MTIKLKLMDRMLTDRIQQRPLKLNQLTFRTQLALQQVIINVSNVVALVIGCAIVQFRMCRKMMKNMLLKDRATNAVKWVTFLTSALKMKICVELMTNSVTPLVEEEHATIVVKQVTLLVAVQTRRKIL